MWDAVTGVFNVLFEENRVEVYAEDAARTKSERKHDTRKNQYNSFCSERVKEP